MDLNHHKLLKHITLSILIHLKLIIVLRKVVYLNQKIQLKDQEQEVQVVILQLFNRMQIFHQINNQ